jgi:prevent-host-death family protein
MKLKNCHKGEPVYLTKNGRGCFVIIDIENYTAKTIKEIFGEFEKCESD